MFPCWISLPWTTGGNSATGFELWFVYSTTECPFRLTINQSKSVQHWFTSPFSSLSLLFSHAGYFKFISLPLVTTAKGWRSLLSHTEFRERRKVRNSVCGWVGKGVCVHSRVSVQFARAYVCVLVCVRNAEMYTHACPFDPELALQLPETQQKASSIHCMSCVFPRRVRAQWEKGPRSLSPDMDVYSLYGPAEHSEKDWPSILTCMTHSFLGKEKRVWEKKERVRVLTDEQTYKTDR